MKPRQLINVLFKVWGLSICLSAIPIGISSIMLSVSHLKDYPPSLIVVTIISFLIGAGTPAAIGLLIIAKSEKIAWWMFKSDEL